MVIDGSCAFFIALYFALISMYLLLKSIFGYLIRIVRKMGALSTVRIMCVCVCVGGWVAVYVFIPFHSKGFFHLQ